MKKHIVRRITAMTKDVQYIYINNIELNVPDSQTHHIEMTKLICTRGKHKKTLFSKKG